MDLRGKSILICEDEECLREILKLFVQREGAKVHECENPSLVLSKIEAINPDCIISDIQMPEMDGYEFADWLVRNELDTIPLIIHSGSIEECRLEQTGHRNLFTVHKGGDIDILDYIDSL